MKSGIKTTEFWVLIAGICAIVFAFAQKVCTVSPEAIMSLAGTVIAYITGRSWVKGKQVENTMTFEDDEV